MEQVIHRSQERNSLPGRKTYNIGGTAVARGAKAINERVQRIKALEGELASQPDEFDAEKLAGLKSKLAGDIARFHQMMSDRRNASLARQVLRKLLVEPIKCIASPRGDTLDVPLAKLD